MLDLLPQQEKEKIKKEYLLRRWSLFFVFLGILGFISLIFLAPAYAVVYLEKQHLEEGLWKTRSSTDELVDSKIFEKTSTASKDLDLLIPHTNDIFVVDIIKIVLDNKPDELSVTSFAIQKDPYNKKFSASISGKSATRTVLLDFSERLRNKDRITKVDIPLASFTQEKDLEFSMKLNGEF